MNKTVTKYFEAFNRKDTAAIKQLLSLNCSLQDPVVGKVTELDAVMEVYQGLFANCHDIDLQVQRVYERSQSSYAVEFSFAFTDAEGVRKNVAGIDLIELEGEKISSLRAYLDLKP